MSDRAACFEIDSPCWQLHSALLLCGCATNKQTADAGDSVIRKSDNTQIHGEVDAFYGSGGH